MFEIPRTDHSIVTHANDRVDTSPKPHRAKLVFLMLGSDSSAMGPSECYIWCDLGGVQVYSIPPPRRIQPPL